MEQPVFFDEVKKNFRYLVDEYDFKMTLDLFDPDVFGNALITLQSSSHLIQIIRERGQVFMRVGLSSNTKAQYDLAMLVKYIDPNSNEQPYHNPDETSLYYSSTEWKLGEVKRVFQKYQSYLLDEEFLRKHKKKLAVFSKTMSVPGTSFA